MTGSKLLQLHNVHDNRNHTSFYLSVNFSSPYSWLKIQVYVLRAKTSHTTSPAKENTCSACVDVAVMARYFLASLANKGNLCSLTFHHLRGDESEETVPV